MSEFLTDEEIAVLNRARDVFEQLDTRVILALRGAPAPDANAGYALGKLSENIGMANNGIYNVLSVLDAYGLATVTDEQLNNAR